MNIVSPVSMRILLGPAPRRCHSAGTIRKRQLTKPIYFALCCRYSETDSIYVSRAEEETKAVVPSAMWEHLGMG